MITPDEARARMPSARARAAKIVSQEIESFIAAGNQTAVIVMPLYHNDNDALLSEIISHRDAGWCVEFERGCAVISLPKVVS